MTIIIVIVIIIIIITVKIMFSLYSPDAYLMPGTVETLPWQWFLLLILRLVLQGGTVSHHYYLCYYGFILYHLASHCSTCFCWWFRSWCELRIFNESLNTISKTNDVLYMANNIIIKKESTIDNMNINLKKKRILSCVLM